MRELLWRRIKFLSIYVVEENSLLNLLVDKSFQLNKELLFCLIFFLFWIFPKWNIFQLCCWKICFLFTEKKTSSNFNERTGLQFTTVKCLLIKKNVFISIKNFFYYIFRKFLFCSIKKKLISILPWEFSS